MNKVQLVGRLYNDVSSSVVGANNTTFVRFGVACDRKFKQEGQPTADFISCVAWGKTAEFIEKHFTKGSRIGLTGHIQTGSYTNKDGQKVYTTDVLVEEVEFVESKGNNSANNNSASDNTSRPTPESASTNNDFMSIPDGVTDIGLPFN